MYIPEHFRVEDLKISLGFMRENPFAILVSSRDEEPFATHIPVVILEDGGALRIRGHVAKGNPHWRYLQAQPRCLVIFHGPHAYISPSNYEGKENVPTWNYGAVHAYGDARLYSERNDLLSMLNDLIPTFEAAYAEQWTGLPESYRDRMLNHIVGFDITVSRLETKFKLNQNRTRAEQARVMESLCRSSDTGVLQTAGMMQRLRLGAHKPDKQ